MVFVKKKKKKQPHTPFVFPTCPHPTKEFPKEPGALTKELDVGLEQWEALEGLEQTKGRGQA